MPQPDSPPVVTLIDLLPDIAAHGYITLQICHFHLESREERYFDAVRAGLAANGIEMDKLLGGDGDLAANDIGPELAWYYECLTVAERQGAVKVRVCAGCGAPTPPRTGWISPLACTLCEIFHAAGEWEGLPIDLGNWIGEHKLRRPDRDRPSRRALSRQLSFCGW